MSAKNYDSKRIFDSYVEKYLTEQETVNLPGVPPIPKSGMTAKVKVPPVLDALMGGETNTYNINAKRAMEARRAAGLPAVAGQAETPQQTPQSSLSLNSNPDLNLQTVRPGEAVAAGTAAQTGLGAVLQPGQTGTGSQQTQVANAPAQPTAEEKELFKKLHGSDFTPGVTNNAKLAQLRQAGQAAGGYGDVEKVRNAAYASQYGTDTEQGRAYAQRAQQMGVTVPRPGEVRQPTPNYAQQAANFGLSPETQRDLAASQSQSPAPGGGMTPDQYLAMGKQLGLSQQNLDDIKKALSKS